MMPPYVLRRAKAVIADGLTPKDEVRWSMVPSDGERGKVLKGKEGWLFLKDDTNDVIGQHTGRVRLGRDGRRSWTGILQKRVVRAKHFGACWLCQIAPDKESVYPEYLPDSVVPSNRRPVHELIDIAHSCGAPVTYPLADLLTWKLRGPLYSQTDTHWNQLGAYAAYRIVCDQLIALGVGIAPVGEESLTWITQRAPGDLGSKLEPVVRGHTLRVDMDQQQGHLIFDNGVSNHGRVMIFEQHRSIGPTVVVFGESFTNQMLFFLKESFRRLVFVHTSMLIPETVMQEGPDVVLSFPLERFLIQPPDDNAAISKLKETVARKARAGEISRHLSAYLRGCPAPAPATLQRQEGTLPW